MALFLLRRLLAFIPLLLGMSVVVFLILQILPGDPAAIIGGQFATQEDIAEIREDLGLNRPLPVQYATFLRKLVTFDLGTSYATRRPVAEMISRRYPATISLAFAAMAIALTLGTLAGMIAASTRNSAWDLLTMLASQAGISIPGFWLGLLLIYYFSVQLGWFPTSGLSGPRYYVLPALALSVFSMAFIARMTRASLVETLGLDYIRSARAKGLTHNRVVFKHALRNAFIPVITIAGLSFGYLLGGSVVIEAVFNINGLGRLVVDSILSRDYPVIQVSILVLAVNVAAANLVVDVCYALLDPRLRY
ncbi:MAG: ABC transporter permease [Truepera sp.]|nr:ABC transporter permease [Truepera sp.]